MKMKSILSDLYEGKLHPDETIMPTDPEYRQNNRAISNTLEVCKIKFSESDFKLLEEVLDLYGTSHAMLNSASFVEGFKVGALMMIEVLTKKGEIPHQV
jgi:hypothetical protein